MTYPKMLLALAFLAPAAATTPTAARAHVLIQPNEAPAGTQQTLSLLVGHGCDGQPTTALMVEIPPGSPSAQPEEKPGWTFLFGRRAGGAWALEWRDPLAPSTDPDTFPFNIRLPAKPGPVVLKVTQTCGDTVVRWDEVAQPGGEKPKHPAPILTLTPPAH